MKRFFLASCLVGLMAMSLSAAPVLDFGVIAPTAGSISYAGGIAPLVGTGIDVDNVTLIDSGTGLPIGPSHSIFLGSLNFSTGNLTSSSATGWVFGPGGTITLSGSVDVNDTPLNPADDITGIIFSGTFQGASVGVFGGSFKIAGASFTDEKNSDLLKAYGLPGGLYSGNFNISFNAAGSPPNGFRSTAVLSGDVTNQAPAVPEPMTVLLLGSGLVGLGAVSRKRRNA